MEHKTPPPKPADPLLLPDDTPCIEGRWPDGTPYKIIKPADPAPPAPKPPVTIADLRERIKRTQQDWIDCAPGEIALRFFVPHQIADWLNDARMIPGAPPPPPMPAPFPGPSDDPQQCLAGADVLLGWLDQLEKGKTATKKVARSKKLDVAKALKTQHPDWTDAQVARETPCDPSYLSRNKEYQTWAETVNRANYRAIRTGARDARTGEIQAIDDGS